MITSVRSVAGMEFGIKV